MTLIADDHYSYPSYSLRRGSSFSVKRLSEPTGAPAKCPIGFRVSQSRRNRELMATALVKAQIQAYYQ